MNRIQGLVVVGGLLSTLAACAQGSDLGPPDTLWNLSPELREISGLTTTADDSLILCLQDERGIVYALDARTGQSAGRWTIAGKGDFEGIELVGEDLYLLRSDGHLWHTRWPVTDSSRVDVIDLGFVDGTDVEGLGYDPVEGHLLLGIKDSPLDTGSQVVKGWICYHPGSVRPDTLRYGVTMDSLAAGIDRHPEPHSGRIRKWLSKEDDREIGPSGLAVHPLTHEIWLLSSRGKVLLVFHPDGELRWIIALDPSVLPQPEGIAFTSNGDLYISSEGRKESPGRIAVFRNPKVPDP